MLQGTRWLLLKNPQHLDPKRHERERLAEALRSRQPLATVYCLKADLRQIGEPPDHATATRVLEDWLRRAAAACPQRLQQFARTLARHRRCILACYDCRISTGPWKGR